ncbi:MAG TPA: PH domain-containing protein [Candidatus Moranbacteria bacterium]|nr:PH domain-containing protein [Candidatus Moranbacteria bacterium]HRZ33491.1 PH domain-containing protein [Candidatus Moranbacteria bacterium]
MDGFPKYNFKDLRQDEKIIKVLHRNWFYLFQQFFILILVASAFVASSFFAPVFFPNFLEKVDKSVILFAQNFFILAIWLYGFMIWIDYYFDIWIITSERIINIEQKGMFSREVSELRFQKIQDVTTKVVGFIPTVLNYGDVRVQTAGEEREFIFLTISNPYDIKNLIMSLQKQCEEHSKNEIEEMLKAN